MSGILVSQSLRALIEEGAIQALLPVRPAQIQLELDQARINETSYFEIVRNADEAMELVRHHAEGFKQAIDALVRAKFKTAEKIDNLTEVFTGIYQIMETSLEMKGFSRIDQTINYAADKTTEAMNRPARGHPGGSPGAPLGAAHRRREAPGLPGAHALPDRAVRPGGGGAEGTLRFSPPSPVVRLAPAGRDPARQRQSPDARRRR